MVNLLLVYLLLLFLYYDFYKKKTEKLAIISISIGKLVVSKLVASLSDILYDIPVLKLAATSILWFL